MRFGGTRRGLAVVVVASAALIAPDAGAQRHAGAASKEQGSPGKARAAELFKKSADAYLHGEFDRAIALLDEAYALDPQPVLLYNKARAHEGLGHVEEAITLYEEYLAQEPASRDRGAIEQRLVTLKRQKDEHVAVVKERSAVEEERAAVAKERATLSAEPPPAPPRPRSKLPYVVAGVGAAGLVTGAVFGLMALSREDAAATERVQRKAIDLGDTGSTFATVSNVGFIAGGVLVVAGAVWWVLDGQATRRRGASPSKPVHLGLGPGFISVGGSFP